MRIACPACAATYEVPDGMLAAGQRVACARCGRDWTPLAGPSAPASDIAIPIAPPRPEPSRAEPSRAEPSRPAQPRPAPPRPPPARPDPIASQPPSLAQQFSIAQPPNPAQSPSLAQPPSLAPPLSAPPDRSPPSAEPSRPDWFPRVAADWGSAEERLPLVTLAWVGSVVLLLALLGAGVSARDSLMARWPPASRLFSALGLDDR